MTYGVVNVRTNHEAFTTAISTVVDGDDVSGLFVHMGEEENVGGWANGWMDRYDTQRKYFVR